MGWRGDLFSKFPTVRGIGRFIHVATDWNHINEQIETYRRQIKDREEWAKQAQEQQAQLHAMVMERILAENENWRIEAAGWRDTAHGALHTAENILDTARQPVASAAELRAALTKAEGDLVKTREAVDGLLSRYVDAAVLIANLLAPMGPLARTLYLDSLDEPARRLVEGIIQRLPPAPPPPELGDLGKILGTQSEASSE